MQLWVLMMFLLNKILAILYNFFQVFYIYYLVNNVDITLNKNLMNNIYNHYKQKNNYWNIV